MPAAPVISSAELSLGELDCGSVLMRISLLALLALHPRLSDGGLLTPSLLTKQKSRQTLASFE